MFRLLYFRDRMNLKAPIYFSTGLTEKVRKSVTSFDLLLKIIDKYHRTIQQKCLNQYSTKKTTMMRKCSGSWFSLYHFLTVFQI